MSTGIEWTDVPGWSGVAVTRDGKVRGPSGKVLKPYVEHRGHLHVLIRHRKLRVHHAVLLAFVGPRPAGSQGRHLNDVPDDNRVENLAWGTALDNADDRRRNRGFARGADAPNAKLSVSDVMAIRRRRPAETLRSLAAEFGISHTAVRRAANGHNWGHVA